MILDPFYGKKIIIVMKETILVSKTEFWLDISIKRL